MADTGSRPLRVSDLSPARPTGFAVKPDKAALQALAGELGLLDLRKLTFTGDVRSEGKRGWRLDGHLGATVVQPCVVTLAPVTTRIEEDVTRRFLPDAPPLAGEDLPEEMEMPEDDSVEALGDVIDPAVVMTETLALALPDYPRADDAGLDQTAFAAPGVTPLDDDAVKPFAGLAGLRDKLAGKD